MIVLINVPIALILITVLAHPCACRSCTTKKKEFCHARCKQCLKLNLPFYSQKCKMMNIFARSVPCQSAWWNTCTHVIYCKLSILPKFKQILKMPLLLWVSSNVQPLSTGSLSWEPTECCIVTFVPKKDWKCLKFVRNTLRVNILHVYLYLHI